MKKIQLFHIAFALLLFCSCVKEVSEIPNDKPINKDGSIAFRTDFMLTKGTPQNDFTAYGKVDLITYGHTGEYAAGKSLYRQIVLNKNGGTTPPTWDYTPPMFWPQGRGLSFLAYSSDKAYATASGNQGVFIKGNAANGAPTIEYVVPSKVEDQPDLLVAALLDHPQVNNVTLPMKHALSCVSFCATGQSGMRVRSIKLKNVYSKASLPLDDASITWNIDKTSKGITIFEPGINPDIPLDEQQNGNYLMTANGYLMMIPQILENATIDVLYRRESDKTEKTITYTLPTTIVWEPGKKYIYKFGEDQQEVVVYYEQYADGSYGFHTWNYRYPNLTPKLDETKEITEAGYGVLTKSNLVSNNPTIKLGSDAPIPAKKISGVAADYNLYAVSQTGIQGTTTFVLPPTASPVNVYFDGNDVACDMITPHFAKGVFVYNLAECPIRTPQQMKNISVLTTDDPFSTSINRVFVQERDLDFAATKNLIGGGTLNGPVVDGHFGGTYNGTYNGVAKSISNVTISTSADYVGLFSYSAGTINDITLKSSSITGGNYVGGIVGQNYGMYGTVNRPKVIGVNSTTGKMTIKGSSYVGGVAGVNFGVITGNPAVDLATEITVAEVSGWVSITGSGEFVGGIAGKNAYGSNGSINTVLVYGVYVKGQSQSDVEPSKIIITGTNYVGGITGDNEIDINGNITGNGSNRKNMPDVAGLVEVIGVAQVGGIAGRNNAYGAAIGKLNSVNLRLGRSQSPLIIKGSGGNVGGIVGLNAGQMGTTTNTFISVRGNVQISGTQNVGGVVGLNSSKALLQNCFVYDYFTRTGATQYFTPTITASTGNVGGIAGSNEAQMINCSVFASNSTANTLTISTPGNNAGGIAGVNQGATNATNESCSVVGKIEIKATSLRSGGIVGVNGGGTTITKCWIGSSDGYGIIQNAIANLGLMISPSPSYGVPTVTGDSYIGGIVGLNDGGIIDGVTLKDNITIGRKDNTSQVGDGSNWVGGIAGGNTPSYLGTNCIIRNCKVENTATTTVIIQGARNLGGIVGLNNGIVSSCSVLGVSSNHLQINGLGTMGGIAGQGGGNDIYPGGTGNDYTMIENCSVTGYVSIQGNPSGWGTAVEVGGIIGLNGVAKDNKNNISGCVVEGAAAQSIKVSVYGTAGGIAGKNSGNIYQSNVKNALIESKGAYAGGITGLTISSATSTTVSGYKSDIKGCNVYSGVTILGPTDPASNLASGALVGYINSSVLMTFGAGATNINWVSNTGVKVNANTPANNSYIFGYNTGDGGLIKADINHTVSATPPPR